MNKFTILKDGGIIVEVEIVKIGNIISIIKFDDNKYVRHTSELFENKQEALNYFYET